MVDPGHERVLAPGYPLRRLPVRLDQRRPVGVTHKQRHRHRDLAEPAEDRRVLLLAALNNDARAADLSCSSTAGVLPPVPAAQMPAHDVREPVHVLVLRARTQSASISAYRSGPTIAASSSSVIGNPGMPGHSSTSADTRSGCASASPSAAAPPWLHPTIAARRTP